jgi:hypothetical protein
VKRLLIALALGVAVFGAVFASAATLGLTSDDLGSDDDVVLSCDNGVTVTYQTAYAPTAPEAGAYVVTSVTLTGLDEAGCAGQTITATLSGAGNASLEELTKTCCDNGTSTEEVLDATAAPVVRAEDVTGVHVVITGP